MQILPFRFDYGERFWVIKHKQFTCHCSSDKCRYNKSNIQAFLKEYYKRMGEPMPDDLMKPSKPVEPSVVEPSPQENHVVDIPNEREQPSEAVADAKKTLRTTAVAKVDSKAAGESDKSRKTAKGGPKKEEEGSPATPRTRRLTRKVVDDGKQQ